MYRILCFAMLFLVCSVLTASAQSDSIKIWYAQGEAAIAAKKYNKAIEAFTKIIGQRDKDPKARVRRAHAYIQRWQDFKALTDLDSVINWYRTDKRSVEPNDIRDAYFMRGDISFATRGYEAAIQDFDTVLRLAPNTPRAYYKRGKLRMGFKDEKGAIDDLTKFINAAGKGEDKNEVVDALCIRAAQYTGLKNYAAAREEYNKAIALGPDSNYVFFLRGEARLNMADSAGAVDDISMYIERERQTPSVGSKLTDALTLRSDLYIAAGKIEEALTDLKELASYNASSPRQTAYGHALNGQLLNSKGRTTEAMMEYNNALRLDSVCIPALIGRGMLHSQLKQYGDAYNDCTSIINIIERGGRPMTADTAMVLMVAYCQRALTSSEQGDTSMALQDLKKVVQLEPLVAGHKSEWKIWETMGAIKMILKDYQGVVVALNKVLQRKESEKPATLYSLLALARLQTGDTLAAMADMTKAIELQPKDASYYGVRGKLNTALGKHKDAVQDFSKAIEYDGNVPEYYYNRARASMHLKNIATTTLCSDIIKAKELGLEEAAELHSKLVQEGLCK